jgi:light-regulated signal transduction histidine kinase (bacteriophytochrome)
LFALQSGDNLTGEQRDLVTMAVEGGKRMSRLISGLLAYSLSGSAELDMGEVDCEAALLEAITNLREAIKDSGAQITHGELPVVTAHPGCMVQLFQNLVGNAIKYRSDARPEIRITAEREGSEWVFSVEDNGIGIEEKFRRRIFQPFGRLHGHDRPGTGLGLAICERIVRKSGGRIWVDSEPGEGSVFHFTARESPNGGRTPL